jgi:hypothetical protein
MSYATLIIGESGTGKTASLRNLDPTKTLLIQPTRKPLPFRSTEWKERIQKGDNGNIFVSDNPAVIIAAMRRTTAEIIVIDDWQYILANMFMAKRNEKGFDKFTSIGGAGFDICATANQLEPQKRVYILAHSTTDELGNTHVKTLGKLLDDKVVVEGMFTTVLRTCVEQGRYMFRTHNSGSDTCKSPIGMFEDELIENDLALVDSTICDYYGIGKEVEPDPDSPDTGIAEADVI